METKKYKEIIIENKYAATIFFDFNIKKHKKNKVKII